MKDKTGQLYQTFAGLVGGACAGTLVPLLADLNLSFTAPELRWILVLTGICCLCVYVLMAVFFDWWLPGRRPRSAELISEAYGLSSEIFVWVSDRRSDEPAWSLDDWDGSTARQSRYGTDTMNRWNQRFGARALAVFDELMRMGNTSDDSIVNRSLVERPTNVLGIEEVARSLGVLAARAERRHFSRG